jgi:hypothetical protein
MDEKPRRIFQLSLRSLLEIVAVVAVVLALVYSRHAGNGRYQLSDSPNNRILLDTTTGECWQWYGTGWEKRIGPVVP